MRESFRGWYKPTDDEAQDLWDRGTIVFDANVLLAPYRISVEARKRLFDVVEAYRAQLWVPYQAGLEYQRNRLTVVAAQRATYAEIRKELDNAEKSLLNLRSDHPVLKAVDFAVVVKRALDAIGRYVDRAEAAHPDVLGNDRDDDLVRDRWDEILRGCVGEALSVDQAFTREADERYEAGIPPGFADRKRDKGARVYGDLILWRELMAYVTIKRADSGVPVPVIFVTDDAKEDWWRKSEGQNLGPHPELVEELADVGGSPFWMYSVSRFMTVGAQRLGWDVQTDVTNEVEATAEQETGDEGSEPAASGESASEAEHGSDTGSHVVAVQDEEPTGNLGADSGST
jgi:hypothetical protein